MEKMPFFDSDSIAGRARSFSSELVSSALSTTGAHRGLFTHSDCDSEDSTGEREKIDDLRPTDAAAPAVGTAAHGSQDTTGRDSSFSFDEGRPQPSVAIELSDQQDESDRYVKADEPAAVTSAAAAADTENGRVEDDAADDLSDTSDFVAVASEGNIHPDSLFRICWDAAMCLILMYYAVMIPLRMVLQLSPYLLIIDYFLDAVMLLDCYMCICVFAIYAAGELLVHDRDIRANYFRNRLLVDAVSGFPYDLIGLAFIGAEQRVVFLVLALLRIPKLVKLWVFNQYYKQLRMVLNKLNFSFAVVRLAELVVALLVVSNWVGCGFLAFAVYGRHPGSCSNEPGATYGTACEFRGTWVEQQIATGKLPADGGGQWSRYLRAFYWAVSTCVGITMGDVQVMNSKEVIFAFFMMIGVLAVNGMIIGSVMSLVAGASEESTEIFRTIEVLKSYLRTHGVAPSQINRAVALLRYFASDEGVLVRNQDKIFAELPHSIRLSIDTQTKTAPYLRRCPVFDFCSDELLRGIASHLLLQFYVRDDYIVTAGELGFQMYFLQAGSVQVLSADGATVFSNLEEGAFFGETAFFFNTARSASVIVSSSFCTCLALNKTDLEHELRSTAFDPATVLEAFSALQKSNARRNEAVQRNLELAADPRSKLHRLIPRSDKDDSDDSALVQLRKALHPSSTARVIWDCAGLLFLGYYSCSIPFYVAFFLESKVDVYISRFVAIDFMVDLYWAVDIALKAMVFSVRLDAVSEKVVIDGSVIWQRYSDGSVLYSAACAALQQLRGSNGTSAWHGNDEQRRSTDFGGLGSGGGGYFAMDVVASLPLELLAALPSLRISTLFYFRTQHLLRTLQIPRQLDIVEGHLQHSLGITLPRALSLLLRVALLYLVLNHWVTCCFFMIHRYAERGEQVTYVTADGFATYDASTGRHDICNDKLSYCYARSLYFVVGAMAGIGYGDIVPYTNVEFVFQIMVAIISAFLAATFLGFCGIFLEDRDALSSNAIKRKLKDVETFLAVRSIPARLRDSVVAQYSHIWRKKRSLRAGRGNELLFHLSQPLSMDLSLRLNAPVLDAIPILRQLPQPVLRRIALSLRPQIALPKSVVYCAGDVGKSMFFICSGSVRIRLARERSVLDSRGLTALRVLLNKEQACGEIHVSGDHFGEYCVLSESGLRTDTAMVMSTTEVYALDKRDLWSTFLYCTAEQRWAILNDLMTRVGEKTHVPQVTNPISGSPVQHPKSSLALQQVGLSPPGAEAGAEAPGFRSDAVGGDPSSPGAAPKMQPENFDGRIQTLYRLAFNVLTVVVMRMEYLGLDILAKDSNLSSEGDDESSVERGREGAERPDLRRDKGSAGHKALRQLLQEQASLSASAYSRKDLIDLFLGQRSNKSSLRFSAEGLRSRLNSMHSNNSFMSQRSLESVADEVASESDAMLPDTAKKPTSASSNVKHRRSIAGTSMAGISDLHRKSALHTTDGEQKRNRNDDKVRWSDQADQADQSEVDAASELLPERGKGHAYKFSSWERRTSKTDFEALKNALEIEERINNGNRRKSVI